ncbi:MAG: aldehyde dehydrogenase family protein [Deltaproteobacteria bacterium]|nr:MAG: aldehyde dehydrogenase family protein [Deltaproteobacteria bacterium]
MARSASLEMSARANSALRTDDRDLDAAIAALRDRAREWARLAPRAKAELVRACIPRVLAAGDEWAATGARARGADPAEEWLAGVTPTVRQLRLFADTLDAIAAAGKPPLGRRARTLPNGRLAIDVFPASGIDRASFAGFTCHCVMDEGVDRDAARRRQAAFYDVSDPDGGVSLILGAGNVSSIPPMDVLSKLVADGFVCLLKMNPVNEWVGPILERAFDPLIRRGYLRIVYGGADVGQYLVYHEEIDDIHITGSDRTHDLIVWGPPGPERDRRQRENDPVLTIPITSELGNVSPVAIVPHAYSDEELWFQARNVVTMVTNNASFNCNAAKMLITSRQWPQRDRFLDMIERGLAAVPPRKAYYPGAFDRYARLTEGRDGVRRIGTAKDGTLPWAVIRDVPPGSDDDLFRVEPFCGILSETALDAGEPDQFLAEATAFMNERLWGTLNAMIVIHPSHERDPTIAASLDRAILDLRYGTVAINHWPALGYAFGTPPWGGHQSSTLADIQSGLGWVHNTYLLDGIDKSVVRGNLVVKPHPAWFYDNTRAGAIAPAVARMEASPSWWKLPGLMWRALV